MKLKKGRLQYLLRLLLTMFIIVSMFMSSVGMAFADGDDGDEYEGGYEEENEEYGEYNEGEEEPLVDYGYLIVPDRNGISFGNVDYRDEGPAGQVTVAVSNMGSSYVDLRCYLSQPGNSFDAYIANSSIDSGDTTFVDVYIDTYSAPGTYNATLYLFDSKDIEWQYAVEIPISGTINPDQPRVYSVQLSPSAPSAATGSTLQFSAEVRGDNNPDTSVTWSVSGAKSGSTSINGSGLLSIGRDESASTIYVQATSVADPSVSSTATVNVTRQAHTVGVQANPASGGIVSGGGSVDHGGSIALTASPSSGYTFVNWTLNGNQVSTDSRFQPTNITSDCTYVANFKMNTCTVRVSRNINYGGNVSGDVSVSYGGKVTVTATPNPGYKFDGWVENNKTVSTSTSYTINNVKENHSLTACFSPTKYTVNIDTNPSGIGTVTGQGSYDAGSNVTVKATGNNGYEFSCWMLNGNVVSQDPNYTINNIKSDYRLTAYFRVPDAKTYNITAGVTSANGSISPAGTYALPEGSSMVYTIVPNNGYVVSNVSVDGVEVGAVTSYTFSNIKGTHTIYAAFTPKPQAQNQPVNTRPSSQTGASTQGSTVSNVPVEEQQQTVPETPVNIVDVEMTDEAVQEEYNLDDMTGVMQDLDINPVEANQLIMDGQFEPMLKMAVANGTVQVNVYNEMSSIEETTATSYDNDMSVPNFAAVAQSVLSPEERMAILSGEPATISLNIYDSTMFITPEEKSMIDAYQSNGVTIADYFDIVLLKSMYGNTEEVTNITVPMKVVIDVPEYLKQENRNFYIIRSHVDTNGVTTVSGLIDEDTNPDTITFTTDRFSSYAIGYVDRTITTTTKTTDSGKALLVVLGATGMLIIGCAIGTAVGGKGKKRRKK